MGKLTVREQRHVNRVFRVLRKAEEALLTLTGDANDGNLFPNTTLKALIETKEVLHRTELRVLARDAKAV